MARDSVTFPQLNYGCNYMFRTAELNASVALPFLIIIEQHTKEGQLIKRWNEENYGCVQ